MSHFPTGPAALVLALAALPAAAQDNDFSDCTGILFSTEEDFISPAGEELDGNPIVSDGDLLALAPDGSVRVCARNNDLLPPGALVEVPQPLGLDAVDAIFPDEGLIAFSTELDEQFGLFGHGDILFPDGTIIPNQVLVARFQLPANMGLDAVHFIGRPERIREAIKLAADLGRDRLRDDPQTYLERIRALGVDIWFSIEGTSEPLDKPDVLDGDLLSAVSGVIARNGVLLSSPIPAGLPDRGVDFGLDAVVADREGNQERIQFSTEILFNGEPQPFTDGDVLRIGGAISIPHKALIQGLEPRADFLGLDALSLVEIDETGKPHIDTLCGRDFAAADFAGDGLWRVNTATTPPGDPPRRPCGMHVPVDGTLPPGLATPSGNMTRFRVVFDSLDQPGFGDQIETTWRLKAPANALPGKPCLWMPAATLTLATDGTDGWMDARDFLDALEGNPTGITGNGTKGCANPHLHFAVWNTLGLPPVRQNDLMEVRLEWETSSGGGTEASPFTYAIQLDNLLPEMPPYPDNLEVRLNDGSLQRVPACGEAPSGESEFQVWSEFDDPHYWFFTLVVEGGDPPTSHAFLSASGDSRHEYFETPDDPALLIKNTDDTGTVPDATLVHLRNIDMTELGGSFKRCCYLLELRVFDAAIRHTFGGFMPSTSIDLNDVRAITTFEAGA